MFPQITLECELCIYVEEGVFRARNFNLRTIVKIGMMPLWLCANRRSPYADGHDQRQFSCGLDAVRGRRREFLPRGRGSGTEMFPDYFLPIILFLSLARTQCGQGSPGSLNSTIVLS